MKSLTTLFAFSLFLLFQTQVWADETLLDVLLKNKHITQKQYDTLKNKQAKSKSFNNGLAFESSDGDSKYAIGGRLMLDAAWYDDDNRDLGNGTNLRRARIFIKGKLFKDWAFKGEYDFADNQVSVKDALIDYKGFSSSIITIGNFKEPFSLEELTSSRFITFMERGLPNAFAPGRNIGIGFMTHWNNGTFAIGAFGEGVGDVRTDDEGYGFSGRITFSPWHKKTEAFHLGLATSFREPDEAGGSVSFSSKPESDITTRSLVDTGDIAGTLNYNTTGLETAWISGPFSFQAEYIWTHLNREFLADSDFFGGYAYISWFLTGESRRYSSKNGKFGRIIPNKNAGKNGIGAWELALRYSTLDLNDGTVLGGIEDNFTLGLNWYLNPRMRFMANFIAVNTDQIAQDDDPRVIQFRAQVDF